MSASDAAAVRGGRRHRLPCGARVGPRDCLSPHMLSTACDRGARSGRRAYPTSPPEREPGGTRPSQGMRRNRSTRPPAAQAKDLGSRPTVLTPGKVDEVAGPPSLPPFRARSRRNLLACLVSPSCGQPITAERAERKQSHCSVAPCVRRRRAAFAHLERRRTRTSETSSDATVERRNRREPLGFSWRASRDARAVSRQGLKCPHRSDTGHSSRRR